MKQTFTCKACGAVSQLMGIQDDEGITFVVCEHCKAKNKLAMLGSNPGAPAALTVVGVLK